MTAQISHLGDPATHFWLTRSMARAVGVSFSEAMACGAMSAGDYAQMVTKCRQCPYVQDCQSWLGARHPRGADAPDFCCHSKVLRQLVDVV
ncbi:DUF6455 family protein [Shimia haliotis]|uniref:DUF6455 domain-containing protein n=1 Tax=Shimia haliotis TaxID=1280847 RepID=A0A1I4G5W8_9RHOB|nr:DUF6455 family protein [Shimia haliotis]SFL24880.1 hypothetical protein SAMN04488036_107167 [Shimia haliotis]